MEKETKEQLVEQNIGLVVTTAKKYSYTGVGLDELISVGNVGLVKAAASFNPQKKFRLSTYACRCIRNEILMYLRKARKYSSREISENVNPYRTAVSLSDLFATKPDAVPQMLEAQEERELLLTAIGMLPEREQTLIRLRYGIGNGDGEGLTQQAVAERLGITQSYVSRLEKRTLRYLRYRIENLERNV